MNDMYYSQKKSVCLGLMMLMAACAFAEGRECQPFLRDRVWMFGHDSGQHDFPGNEYNIPVSSKVTMGDACRLMGVSNVVACVWDLDYADDYLAQFKGLKRVVWCVDNGHTKRHAPTDEYPQRFANALKRKGKMDNLVGFEYDDFFNGWSSTGTCADALEDGTPVTVQKGARTLAELREARKRIRQVDPKAEMRLVLYTEELVCGEALQPVIDLFDTVTLWTWNGGNLGALRERVMQYRKLVGDEKPTLLGVYMWDFGGAKAIGVETMKRQLDVALELFQRGLVDGVVFHCTPLVNKNLPEVELVRDWISRNGSVCHGKVKSAKAKE